MERRDVCPDIGETVEIPAAIADAWPGVLSTVDDGHRGEAAEPLCFRGRVREGQRIPAGETAMQWDDRVTAAMQVSPDGSGTACLKSRTGNRPGRGKSVGRITDRAQGHHAAVAHADDVPPAGIDPGAAFDICRDLPQISDV